MAKKKKKQQKSTKASRSGYVRSVDSQRRELVQKIYQFSFDEINRRIPKNTRLYDGFDFDPIRLKRRISATAASIDELKENVSGICEEVPGIFTFEEDWAMANALACPAYDCQEEESTATLGAAIWILDQIREAGRIPEAIRLMPKDDGTLDEIDIPPVWDPCHSEEVLLGMMYIIQKRNTDCVGTKKSNSRESASPSLNRFFMDELTAQGKQKQSVDSRIRFETVLSLIPKEAIDKAVQHYREIYWDWVKRYYTCRNHILQKEIQLDEERKAYFAQFRATAEDLMRKLDELEKNPPSFENFNPHAHTFSLDIFNSPQMEVMRLLEKREAQEEKFDERVEDYEGELTILQSTLCCHRTMAYSELEKAIGSENAALWKDFYIDNPYEILFAHLYLLDSGSDLPWLYFPGVALFTCAAESLPWVTCDYDDGCDGIWSHWDTDAEDVIPGPAQWTVSQKVKIPELENWYQPMYRNKNLYKERIGNCVNLAQVVFEITGGIMPRKMDRYYPALADLEMYGITGKKMTHPLLYVMLLLGEGRRQSRDWRLEFECEEDRVDASGKPIGEEKPEPEAPSLDELKQKNMDLQKQLEHAKKVAYDAGRELREEKKRKEKLEQKLEQEQQELADLRDLVFNQQENLYEDESTDESITFPYHTTLKIVVFGGHDSWAKEIKPKLPDVRFVDREMLPNAELIRRADAVWIQSNALSHKFFYKIIDEVRKYNVPVRYFSYASARKCAEQIAQFDAQWST